MAGISKEIETETQVSLSDEDVAVPRQEIEGLVLPLD